MQRIVVDNCCYLSAHRMTMYMCFSPPNEMYFLSLIRILGLQSAKIGKNKYLLALIYVFLSIQKMITVKNYMGVR